MNKFDVVIVGGGHAGIEAASAAARLGSSTALIIPNPDKIGLMPCNPAVGGPGKSQIVFELHALGGEMGKLADQTAIHARTLNASKGPAVQSLRVQNERDAYAAAAQARLAELDNLKIISGEVAEIIVANAQVCGLRLTDGRELKAPSVVLCTGTFLSGVVWYGKNQRAAGRQGEAPARYLSASLRALGHNMLRFKTGTPPRIRADTVDFSVLEEVPADDPPASFSGQLGPRVQASPTWLTHTTPETHRLIQENLAHSAMYGGDIEGRGPRYCPSIEDKVVRFADKERHLLFVEPDGMDTSEVYLQGFSSSMPPFLQDDMIRTLPGFEGSSVQRYAYAVEYDVLDPTMLAVTMMSKRVAGLFSAGQINGTSGYEEAAAQGLIAGVNAARHAAGEKLVALRRDEGYIGVMLDDLVRWGLDEPYRMLTSRNEYRLLHRQDNADARLLATGFDWGLRDHNDVVLLEQSQQRIAQEVLRLGQSRIAGTPAAKVLCRPGTSYTDVELQIGPAEVALSTGEKQKVEISVKYAAYIERSRKELAARKGYEGISLVDIDYGAVPSLSHEGKQALINAAPTTLAAAKRVRGVRDSDVTALLVHCKASSRRKAGAQQNVSRETLRPG